MCTLSLSSRKTYDGSTTSTMRCETFALIDMATGQPVLERPLLHHTTEIGVYGVADFTHYREPGEYSLRIGDLSTQPFPIADDAWWSSIWKTINFFYAERDSRLLYHIDQALDRIEAGAYGQCEMCGQDIGFDRLFALPHARLCIQCKSEEEGGDKNGFSSPDSLSVLDEEYGETF